MELSMNGVVDLHLHGMPSLVQRMNPWDYVMEMDAAGYRACVIQDHSGSTAGLAYAIEHAPVRHTIQVFGTLVMNAAAGGIRLAAVESAHRMGVRRISFPTTSSPQQLAYLKKYDLTFGGGALHCEEERVSPLDETGALTESAEQVLQYIKDHPELVLSTGYMSPREIDAVVRRARSIGIQKVLVDHPYAIVEAAPEQIRAWAELGAYIEFTAANFAEISVSGDLAPERLKDFMQGLPIDRMVLSSDFGQTRNGSPVAGLRRFAETVLSFGYSMNEAEQMLKTNAAHLLFD